MSNSMRPNGADSQQVDWYADRDLMNWLANGERGISSNAIVERITGITATGRFPGLEPPADPDDFRRCERLLRAVPSLRPFLSEMDGLSPYWRGLVENWNRLVELCEAEAPGVFDTRHPRGKAPVAYRVMKRLERRDAA